MLFGQLGQLDQVTSGASDSETREALIKNHFSKRVNEMMLQHQQLDSKCVAFHSEVRGPQNNPQKSYWDSLVFWINVFYDFFKGGSNEMFIDCVLTQEIFSKKI